MSESLTCSCCGSAMLRQAETRNGFAHWRCGTCGFQHFDRPDFRPTADLYSEDADYDLDSESSDRELWRWCHRNALDWLVQRGLNGQRLLDIGCGNGFFVSRARGMGFDAYGVDFNHKTIERGAKRFGLERYLSTRRVEDLAKANDRFDVVSLFDVVEHLQDPADALAAAASVVPPGGHLMVAVPNANMVWRPSVDFPPHHLSRFTPAALARLVERHGFSVVHASEEMSTSQLIRNAVGSMFRRPAGDSLRGGTFRAPGTVASLKRLATRMQTLTEIALAPVDRVAHFSGLRYISQLLIANKRR